VSSGSARIDATSGAVVGSATLIVVSPSTAVTIASTAITGTSAVLIGSVNPRGADTQAWFEWGTDPNLAAPTVTPTRSMGAGTADVGISEAISGLVPNATYYFRVAASSAGGTVRGATLSFTTPRLPTVTTAGADPTTTQVYVVRGSVTPNGSATTAYFEYGTSPTLSSSTQTAKQSIGSGQTAVSVTQALGALQPSTTYYVRIVATNVGGTSVGAIVSFRTSGPPIIGAEGGQLPPGTCQLIQGGGEANPNGATTDGWFEYGSSPTLTTFFSTPHVNLGSGTSIVHFDIAFGGSNTIYFRIAASNVWGTNRHPTILSLTPSTCIR
jgi:phosphodiesterase/alkaline phosphatase D-like protein